MVVVPMVDSAYGTPISSATDATARSPSVCIMRVKPVGAKTNGKAERLPRMSRPVSTRRHVVQHRRAELHPGERLPGAAQRVLAVGRAVAVVEHRAWGAAPRDLPEVGDRRGAPQPSLGGVTDERGGPQQRGELGRTGQASLDHARSVSRSGPLFAPQRCTSQGAGGCRGGACRASRGGGVAPRWPGAGRGRRARARRGFAEGVCASQGPGGPRSVGGLCEEVFGGPGGVGWVRRGGPARTRPPRPRSPPRATRRPRAWGSPAARRAAAARRGTARSSRSPARARPGRATRP